MIVKQLSFFHKQQLNGALYRTNAQRLVILVEYENRAVHQKIFNYFFEPYNGSNSPYYELKIIKYQLKK